MNRRAFLSNPIKRAAIAALTWPAYGPYPAPPDPELGLPFLNDPFTVMASPPTVTVGTADAVTVISGGVDVPFGNAAFSYFGVRATQGTGFPDELVLSPLFAASAGTIYSTGRWGVEFEYDGAEFELWMKRNGADARYRLTVDGDGYESQGGHAGETTGGFYRVHYDLGSATPRRLRFDFAGNFGFLGITRAPTAFISATARPLGPTVVILGDSFTEGSNALAQFSMFADRMEQYLGWRNVAASGQGSTGYVNDGAYVSFDTRFDVDVIDAAPDVVIYAGGINDQTAYVEATFEAAVDALFDAHMVGIPDARGIVLGPFWPDGDPVANVIKIRDSLREAALAHDFLFIDNIGGTVPYTGTEADYLNTGWLTGTGYVGNEQADGNADTYTSADGTHYTQAGHDYVGLKIADAISVGATDLLVPYVAMPVEPVDSGYGDVVLATAGLVAYWRLNESSGTVATDASGNGNHGTVVGSPAMQQAGLIALDANRAYTLDGSNDTITWLTSLIDGTSAWSIEMLVRTPASKTGSPIIFGVLENIGGNTGLEVKFNDYGPTGVYRFNNAGGGSQGLDGTNFTAGTIVHLVVTYDGSNLRLYEQGALTGAPAAVTGSVGPLSLPLCVGSLNGSSRFLGATVDEVAFYDVTLSGATVAAHHAAGT